MNGSKKSQNIKGINKAPHLGIYYFFPKILNLYFSSIEI